MGGLIQMEFVGHSTVVLLAALPPPRPECRFGHRVHKMDWQQAKTRGFTLNRSACFFAILVWSWYMTDTHQQPPRHTQEKNMFHVFNDLSRPQKSRANFIIQLTLQISHPVGPNCQVFNRSAARNMCCWDGCSSCSTDFSDQMSPVEPLLSYGPNMSKPSVAK